jgi:L-threonylcarbamoyladenylate synthase
VAYPTDTSYGLAVDSENPAAIKRLYKVKERQGMKPVHVIVPSLTMAKKIAHFDRRSEKLAKKFWPGPLTLVLWLKSKKAGYKMLSAGSGTIGMRIPKNKFAMELSKKLGRPITTTSANPSAHLSGGFDSYSASDVVKQFQKKKYQPDIVINYGRLPKRKPSTVLRLLHEPFEILRVGPVSKKQLDKALGVK